MPAAIVAVASTVAGAAVATGIGLTVGTIAFSLVSAVVGLAVSSVLGSAMGLNKQPKSQSVENLSKGVLLNTSGSVDPIMVVYGKRKSGGTRVLCEVAGESNDYLHLVIVHGEGPIAAIEQVYLDDLPVSDGKFDGLVHVETFLGGDDQAACQTLIDALPGKWTANHRLRGVAYTYVRLKYDQNVFHSLPIVTADIAGRLVFDPRSGATAWSDNPALCIRDYLTHPRYGRGIPADSIDDAAFIVAANVCDQTFTAPDNTTHKRHTCNGVINTDQTSGENTDNLRSCCRGMLIFSAAGYGLVVDKAEVPSTFAFSEDNITGAWRLSPGSKRSTFNRVRGNWFNPGRSWQPDIAVADSASYRAADNGMMLEAQIELPFTTNPYESQVLVDRHLKQSRFGMTATFHAFLSGMFCQVGDVVPITHSTPGWVAKPFRILRISLLSSDEVEVEVAEYDDSVYAPTPLTAPRTSPVTNLPDPTQAPPAPAGVTLASGTAELVVAGDGTIISRIRVAWPVPADAFWRTTEVEYRRASDAAWSPAGTVSAPLAECHIGGVADGAAYEIRLRHENVMGRRSAWTALDPHVVVGKSEPPAAVVQFAATLFPERVVLSWAANSEPDFDEYEVRAGAAWVSAPLVARVRATSLTLPAQVAGTHTWLIKARDTSGNEAVDAPPASLTVHAPAAPSVSTAFAGGDLVLDWGAPAADQAIDRYQLRVDGISWDAAEPLAETYATTFRLKAAWPGARSIWVAAVDVAGNVGTPTLVTPVVLVPTAPRITAQVIDNMVLLYWTECARTLPIQDYEIRRGPVFSAATVIGTKDGLFTLLFETQAGVYTYWIVGRDSAGNYGEPASFAATVSQPPDYVLRSDIDSLFEGTLYNAVLDDGTVVLPVNAGETVAEHFDARSWASPQDQVDAGYPIYIQPGLTEGYYEEERDYGALLASNKVTVTPTLTTIAGNPQVSVTISAKAAEGDAWTDYPGMPQVYLTNFRYVKVRITVTGDGHDLVSMSALNIRLDSKQKSVSGVVDANAADADGTVVYLTDDGTATGQPLFVDVIDVAPNARAATPCSTGYALADAPYPLSVSFFLFNSATGARLSGPVSYTIRGV